MTIYLYNNSCSKSDITPHSTVITMTHYHTEQLLIDYDLMRQLLLLLLTIRYRMYEYSCSHKI